MSAPQDPPPFDVTTAHPARVYDYLLGGKDNFAADRTAAEAIIEVSPVVFAQYVPDADDPRAIISRLMSAVPSGSFLAMSDTTRDIDTEAMTTGAQRYNAKLGSAIFTPRTGAEYTRFFDQLSLVEPGLVPMPRWRPDPDSGPAEVIPMYAAIGRKP